jgi:hypothetical protein
MSDVEEAKQGIANSAPFPKTKADEMMPARLLAGAAVKALAVSPLLHFV